MKYRLLGKTGLKVSEIGMGTWQLANDPNCWVGSDLDESLKTLHKFVELGGNFIDTAWIYGYSDSQPNRHPSEKLIGKFLKETNNRENLVIATKVPPKNMKWPAWKGLPIEEVFPNDWIESCVNDSLKSLGVDVIDLVQFHVWQDYFVNQDGWKECVQKIIKSGKVRYWGISINDYQPNNCLLTLETGLISTIQFIYNIFHQAPTKKLMPYAKEHNIGLIARVPLDEGGLTGKFTLDTKFDDGDFRKNYFSPERLTELVSRTDTLKSLLRNEAITLPELALRFILSFDEISVAIPGIRRVKYAQENTAVSEKGKLSIALMDKLKNHSWERNFYAPDAADPNTAATNYMEI